MDDAEMLADSTYQQGMYETYHKEDEDKAHPEKTAAPRNITNDGPQNNGLPSQMRTEDVARRPAVPDAASVKGEPDVQEILCHEGVQDSIDVPGAAANKSNTNSPEDGQTNRMADKPRPRRSQCLPWWVHTSPGCEETLP